MDMEHLKAGDEVKMAEEQRNSAKTRHFLKDVIFHGKFQVSVTLMVLVYVSARTFRRI